MWPYEKKILFIGSLALVLLFVLAVLFMAKNSLGISTGTYILSDHGASLIVIEDSPVSMHSQRENTDLFEKLSNGDRVLILHDGIAESYPGKTGVYFVLKLSDGSVDDVPAEVISSLQELGWLSES